MTSFVLRDNRGFLLPGTPDFGIIGSTNRSLRGKRNGYGQKSRIKLQSNKADRYYRDDDRPRDMAPVPGMSEDMVGHAPACDRKIDGANYVVLYRGGLSLYPKRKKVSCPAVLFRCNIAFCV